MKYVIIILSLLALKLSAQQAQCDPMPDRNVPDHQRPIERTVKEAHRPAIVRLREICGHGCSGVVIAKGLVLTAAHCTRNSPFAFVRFENDMASPGIVIAQGSAALTTTDWALIKADTGDIEPLKLACSEHYPQSGVDATCGGKDWPYQQEFPVNIVGIVSEYPGVQYLSVHGPIDHGDSGSPILDMHGDIIGIVSRGIGNDNEAIPLSVLRAILNNYLPIQTCPR